MGSRLARSTPRARRSRPAGGRRANACPVCASSRARSDAHRGLPLAPTRHFATRASSTGSPRDRGSWSPFGGSGAGGALARRHERASAGRQRRPRPRSAGASGRRRGLGRPGPAGQRQRHGPAVARRGGCDRAAPARRGKRPLERPDRSRRPRRSARRARAPLAARAGPGRRPRQPARHQRRRRPRRAANRMASARNGVAAPAGAPDARRRLRPASGARGAGGIAPGRRGRSGDRRRRRRARRARGSRVRRTRLDTGHRRAVRAGARPCREAGGRSAAGDARRVRASGTTRSDAGLRPLDEAASSGWRREALGGGRSSRSWPRLSIAACGDDDSSQSDVRKRARADDPRHHDQHSGLGPARRAAAALREPSPTAR